MDITDIVNIAKLIVPGVTTLLSMPKEHRLQTANYLDKLAETFSEFRPALNQGNTQKVNELLGETRRLVENLSDNRIVAKAVGEERFPELVRMAEEVKNAKDELAKLGLSADAQNAKFTVIDQAIGSLKGYALILRAFNS
jgi:hypothetical protein